MKRMITYSLILLLSACAEHKQLSPSATAKIVIESFYQKDNVTLKKHTTTEGYDGLMAIQNLIGDGKTGNSDFKVLEETVEGDTAWVKFTTTYDAKPETFKLLKEDGQWKVTKKALREKGPF